MIFGKLMLALSTFLLFATAFGYNHRKCMTWKSRGYTGVVGLTFSSSSFVSSTGDCALIGSIEQKKEAFITYNLEKIKVDSARGQGEYLSAYASLSGCSEMGTQKLGSALQKNFAHVFGGAVESLESSSKQAYERIERLILAHDELSRSCHNKS